MSMKKTQADYLREKESLKYRIGLAINRICTGDGKCGFGYCQFNNRCYKPDVENKKHCRQSLKSVLKNITNYENKKRGRRSHTDFGNGIFEIAKTFLGCEVEEHQLIKNHPAVIAKIKKCTTLNQIVKILEKQQFIITSRGTK